MLITYKAYVLIRIHITTLFFRQQYVNGIIFRMKLKAHNLYPSSKTYATLVDLKFHIYFITGLGDTKFIMQECKNFTLFKTNIIDTPLCTCGIIEDAEHYFFYCH